MSSRTTSLECPEGPGYATGLSVLPQGDCRRGELSNSSTLSYFSFVGFDVIMI